MRQIEKDLLEKCKGEKGYPPRKKVEELSMLPGARQNSRWAQLVAKAYQESAVSTLQSFTDLLTKNAPKLSLNSDSQFTPILQEAMQTIFTEARALLIKDVGQSWMNYASPEIDETGMLDSLMSRVRLRDLDLEYQRPMISITASHVGNVVVGNVSQSELRGSVQHLVQSGNITVDAGGHLDTLLAAIDKMGEHHRAEQQQLYDLIKGLAHQLELTPEKRSPTTIQAIWEKIVQTSQVSGEVLEIVKQIGPYLLPLLLSISSS